MQNNLAWISCTCPDARFRNLERAIESASKAVELDPTNGDFWNTLGIAYYRAGIWSKAIDSLRRSTELRHGGDGNDWFFLAMAEWQAGNRDVARDWYNKAIDRMQTSSDKNEELARFQAEAEEMIG